MPSFVEIGLPVLEKKSFEGFLPYMGKAAILDMSPRFLILAIGSGELKSKRSFTLKQKRCEECKREA